MPPLPSADRRALRLAVRGVVQGVGFRPFVYRLARELGLAGWVLNGPDGVAIHVEGDEAALGAFAARLAAEPPPAARIASLETEPAAPAGFASFEIRASAAGTRPTTRVSPDLPLCANCRRELFDPADRRFGYPYINCTDCGPRFSIVRSLPYDRPRTTMAAFPLCPDCAREYEDPLDRRHHAQPVACPVCGPHYVLESDAGIVEGDGAAIAAAARLLASGGIVGVKGIGGYHLACDARDAAAVERLRERKVRKERPFALMAADEEEAGRLVALDGASRALLRGAARPIVLAPARVALRGVAPDCDELGVMLPYAPIHELLFAAGAPRALVMTSGNRSSEPIAFDDDAARADLAGIADALLVGGRPIARRVDDSVVRQGPLGPQTTRRSRGFAPATVGDGWPRDGAILALGSELKNSLALVVDGQAFVGPHVGDLDQLAARDAFEALALDFLAMYEVDRARLVVVHDAHPECVGRAFAARLGAASAVAVQHHRAHVASVLAERAAWEERVVGVAWDGTGWGDDGAVWGGEFFVGGLAAGLERVGALAACTLPGGDAAALYPPQALAGYVAWAGLDADWAAPPFSFPPRFFAALELARRGVRVHRTSSVGRLFDAAAALCGFVRAPSFEGQAAMWLEHEAERGEAAKAPAPAPTWDGRELDPRPLLAALAAARVRGAAAEDVARSFHEALAAGLAAAAIDLAARFDARTVVLSGGVFQNVLLLRFAARRLADAGLAVWANHEVPPNDGGVALGQAALAAARGRGDRR